MLCISSTNEGIVLLLTMEVNMYCSKHTPMGTPVMVAGYCVTCIQNAQDKARKVVCTTCKGTGIVFEQSRSLAYVCKTQDTRPFRDTCPYCEGKGMLRGRG